jgi:hypothetical protein
VITFTPSGILKETFANSALEAPKKTDVTLYSFFSEFFSTVWVTITLAAKSPLAIEKDKKMEKNNIFMG